MTSQLCVSWPTNEKFSFQNFHCLARRPAKRASIVLPVMMFRVISDCDERISCRKPVEVDPDRQTGV